MSLLITSIFNVLLLPTALMPTVFTSIFKICEKRLHVLSCLVTARPFVRPSVNMEWNKSAPLDGFLWE